MFSEPIYIVGAGNVGWALSQLFYQFGLKHSLLNARNLSQSEIQKFEEKSLVFITVNDAFISTVAKTIRKHNTCNLIHCSGATQMQNLGTEDIGVWYPVYSFTKGIPVDWAKVMVCLEASDTSLYAKLEELTNCCEIKHLAVDSIQRLHLHLAAVFASNFSVAAVIAAQEILAQHQLPTEMLNHLALQSIQKIGDKLALPMLTGPAVRGDEATIQKHLALLINKTELKTMYKSITEFIQNISPK